MFSLTSIFSACLDDKTLSRPTLVLVLVLVLALVLDGKSFLSHGLKLSLPQAFNFDHIEQVLTEIQNRTLSNFILLPRYMKCRRGLAMRILSVCPSVCLSVCLSHA